MLRIQYQGNIEQYLTKLFSKEFLTISHKTHYTFSKAIYDQFCIMEELDDTIIPTDKFEMINQANGSISIECDNVIINEIQKHKLSSEQILSIIITELLLNGHETLLKDTNFVEEDFDFDQMKIDELITKQYDGLPDFILNQFKFRIYNFCSEFDLSIATCDKEYYSYVLENYTGINFQPYI